LAKEFRHFLLSDVTGTPPPEIGILDIGALPTAQPRYQRLVDQNCARVTPVEPFEKALQRLSEHERDRFIDTFLGDGSDAVFHETRYPGCSSLFEPDPAVIDTFQTIGCDVPNGNFKVEDRRPVKTMRLDDFPSPPHADLISIDTQGSELRILENGRNVLSKALVVECEVEFLRLYKDQPLFGHIQSMLDAEGFVLHKLVDLVGRPVRGWDVTPPLQPVSQMLWADAIFLRDFNRLDLFNDEELLKAATILNDVYLSYDMVFLLLREHDERNDGAWAGAYKAKFLEYRPTHRLYANLKGEA